MWAVQAFASELGLLWSCLSVAPVSLHSSTVNNPHWYTLCTDMLQCSCWTWKWEQHMNRTAVLLKPNDYSTCNHAAQSWYMEQVWNSSDGHYFRQVFKEGRGVDYILRLENNSNDSTCETITSVNIFHMQTILSFGDSTKLLWGSVSSSWWCSLLPVHLLSEVLGRFLRKAPELRRTNLALRVLSYRETVTSEAYYPETVLT